MAMAQLAAGPVGSASASSKPFVQRLRPAADGGKALQGHASDVVLRLLGGEGHSTRLGCGSAGARSARPGRRSARPTPPLPRRPRLHRRLRPMTAALQLLRPRLLTEANRDSPSSLGHGGWSVGPGGRGPRRRVRRLEYESGRSRRGHRPVGVAQRRVALRSVRPLATNPQLEVSETVGLRARFGRTSAAFQGHRAIEDDRHEVLMCREIDTNLDGMKDVVRTFNEKGEPLHEEADTNYDGRIDDWINFAERSYRGRRRRHHAGCRTPQRVEVLHRRRSSPASAATRIARAASRMSGRSISRTASSASATTRPATATSIAGTATRS